MYYKTTVFYDLWLLKIKPFKRNCIVDKSFAVRIDIVNKSLAVSKFDPS
jgi:hypothetical protein